MVSKVEHSDALTAVKRQAGPVLVDALPYWHASGDITLRVKNKGTEYQFRVHQAVLSVHSLVWADMFQLGSKQSSSENGLPVVPLEDRVTDICSLIWAFYYGLDEFHEGADLKDAIGLSMFGEDTRDTTDFGIILGLLRVSHKYQADRVHKAMIRLLLESWPLERDKYFAIKREQRQRVASSIELIKAARATNCAALLPTAFYELATVPTEHWTGDGTNSNKLSFLSPEDLTCLFLGKSRMLRHYKHCIQNLITKFSQENTSGNARCCNRGVILFKLRANLGVMFLDGTPDLEKSFAIKSMKDIGWKDCDTCEKWIFPLLRSLEVQAWRKIPSDFNLPTVANVERGTPRRRRVFLL